VGDAEHPRSLCLVVQHDALHVPLLGTKWAPKALSQQLYVPPDQAQGLVRKTRLQNGPENAVFGAISVGRITIRKTVVAVAELNQGLRERLLATKWGLPTGDNAAFYRFMY
jgi:hypothetical protein